MDARLVARSVMEAKHARHCVVGSSIAWGKGLREGIGVHKDHLRSHRALAGVPFLGLLDVRRVDVYSQDRTQAQVLPFMEVATFPTPDVD